MKFPGNLKKIRKKRGISQKDLAARLGVGQSCIANWEGGARNPGLPDILALAKALKVTTGSLTGSILDKGDMEVFANATTIAGRVPFYSSHVSAGFPSPADDYVEKRLNLNDLIIKNPPATFFVKATGDSMINAGIHDGDILVVDRSAKPSHNSIVIAVLNGELTVKRINRSGKRLFLMPENEEFEKIEVTEDTEFVVWGVVTSVIHPV